MKKLFVLFALPFSIATYAQNTGRTASTFKHPNYNPTPNVTTGQMLNTANAYGGTLQIDTLSASASIGLSIADYGTNAFVPYLFYGDGALTVGATCTKISGSPAIKATLYQSPNGTDYFPVMSTTTPTAQDTFTVSNVSGAQGFSWYQPTKASATYKVNFVATSATQASTCKVIYTFTQKITKPY